MRFVTLILSAATALVLGTAGPAPAQAPPAYGPAITLEQPLKVLAGAEAEASPNLPGTVPAPAEPAGDGSVEHRSCGTIGNGMGADRQIQSSRCGGRHS
jgi:hypothetical protein